MSSPLPFGVALAEMKECMFFLFTDSLAGPASVFCYLIRTAAQLGLLLLTCSDGGENLDAEGEQKYAINDGVSSEKRQSTAPITCAIRFLLSRTEHLSCSLLSVFLTSMMIYRQIEDR